MGDFTHTAEDAIADALANNTDFTGLSELWFSAHDADPGQSPDGTTEIDDANRQQVAAGDLNTSGNAPVEITNGVEVEFNEATVDWGDVTHLVAWDEDEDTTDEPYLIHELVDGDGNPDPKTINEGDILRFPAGDITFEID